MKTFDVSGDLSEEILAGHDDNLKRILNEGAFSGLSLVKLPLTKENIHHYRRALTGFKFSLLNLDGCEVSDQILPLVLAMAHDLGVKHLDLSDNPLTVEGYHYLFANLGCIKKLTLQFNKIDSDLLKEIAPLMKLSQLHHLDIRNNSLGDGGLVVLGEIISQIKTLSSVFVLKNSLHGTGLQRFIDIIANSDNSFLVFSDLDKLLKPYPDLFEQYRLMIRARAKPLSEFLDLGEEVISERKSKPSS